MNIELLGFYKEQNYPSVLYKIYKDKDNELYFDKFLENYSNSIFIDSDIINEFLETLNFEVDNIDIYEYNWKMIST